MLLHHQGEASSRVWSKSRDQKQVEPHLLAIDKEEEEEGRKSNITCDINCEITCDITIQEAQKI